MSDALGHISFCSREPLSARSEADSSGLQQPSGVSSSRFPCVEVRSQGQCSKEVWLELELSADEEVGVGLLLRMSEQLLVSVCFRLPLPALSDDTGATPPGGAL